MKDIGEAKKILGKKITWDKATRTVWLTQKQYLKKVLQWFGIEENAEPISTPLASQFKLSEKLSLSTEKEKQYIAQVPYASLVGSLMYTMVCIRPDLSQSVSMISRYMRDLGKKYWEAAKWVLKYIKGTEDLG